MKLCTASAIERQQKLFLRALFLLNHWPESFIRGDQCQAGNITSLPTSQFVFLLQGLEEPFLLWRSLYIELLGCEMMNVQGMKDELAIGQ